LTNNKKKVEIILNLAACLRKNVCGELCKDFKRCFDTKCLDLLYKIADNIADKIIKNDTRRN